MGLEGLLWAQLKNITTSLSIYFLVRSFSFLIFCLSFLMCVIFQCRCTFITEETSDWEVGVGGQKSWMPLLRDMTEVTTTVPLKREGL